MGRRREKLKVCVYMYEYERVADRNGGGPQMAGRCCSSRRNKTLTNRPQQRPHVAAAPAACLDRSFMHSVQRFPHPFNPWAPRSAPPWFGLIDQSADVVGESSSLVSKARPRAPATCMHHFTRLNSPPRPLDAPPDPRPHLPRHPQASFGRMGSKDEVRARVAAGGFEVQARTNRQQDLLC